MEVCLICATEIGEKTKIILPCDHLFCSPCLSKYFAYVNKCPHCEQEYSGCKIVISSYSSLIKAKNEQPYASGCKITTLNSDSDSDSSFKRRFEEYCSRKHSDNSDSSDSSDNSIDWDESDSSFKRRLNKLYSIMLIGFIFK